MLMLKFISAGQGSAEDGEFSPEKARAFLSSLPTNDPRRASGQLIAKLVALNEANLTGRARLRVLDMFRDHIDWLLPQLEVRVSKVTPPIPANLRETAYCIEKLLKELATGYGRAVLEVPRSWLPLGISRQIQTPLTRAMDFHARRLALSQRLYARSPGSVWADLHKLFQVAREWGIAEQEIESPRTSPLRVYRDALLLAFAQPTKLMHGDFSRVQAYLAAHGELTELASGRKLEDPSCVFAIDSRRDKPGVAYTKRADTGYRNGELVLLTHRLVERLESQLKRLRDGIAPAGFGLPEEARTPAYHELNAAFDHALARRPQEPLDAHALPPPRRTLGGPAQDLARGAGGGTRRDAAGRHHRARDAAALEQVDHRQRELAGHRAEVHGQRAAADQGRRAGRAEGQGARLDLRVPGALDPVEQPRALRGSAAAARPDGGSGRLKIERDRVGRAGAGPVLP